MSQEPSTETFQDLGRGDWEADLLNSRHILLVNEELPPHLNVMLDQSGDDGAGSLVSMSTTRKEGIMDLVSSEYTSVLPRHNVVGVRDEISAYIEAVESDGLDGYQTKGAV
jgi:hypothetical protein